MTRKKTQRLLLYDYQRTIRYYTIYGTFKSWSSDDFTTIPRLFYRRNYDYWLRLLLASISIGRKPEKRYGGSRQWFRTARRAPAAGLPRRACMVCDMLHRLAWIYNRGAPLHPYIPYYNRAAVLTCIASGVTLVSA